MLRLSLMALTLGLAGCATAPDPVSVAPTAFATGAVSSAEPRATQAGEAMLALGGSATDAALAVLLALTVVEPQSSGIGGGSFMLHSDAAGNVTSYDGRETAPAAAGPDWFLGADGAPVAFSSVVPGGKSVGVPGNVALMAMVHDRYGRLEWAQLFGPAIVLARDGFPMTQRLKSSLEGEDFSRTLTPAQRAIFFGEDGAVKPVGSRITNPELADFLEALAAGGPSAFYVGDNALLLSQTVREAAVAPARLTPIDLGSYEAKQRAPVCADYRAHKICSMGPPSSGATTVLQILGLLERFDLSAMGPEDPRFWHLFAEATRVAWTDRDAYLGDADFVDVPVAGLIDDAYLDARSRLIAMDGVAGDIAAGMPAGASVRGPGTTPRESGTSHFAVADANGNVVSITSTIEGAFGSGLMVNGYFLNNELTDFSFAPVDDEGRPVANAIAAGKRPRSSMSPAIVFAPDGRAMLAVGAAGGPTIITQTAKNIIGVIDFGLTAQAAIDLPNLYAPGDTVFVERHEGAEALATALRGIGHEVRVIDPRFKANAVEYRDGRWIAAVDPRVQKDVTGVSLP